MIKLMTGDEAIARGAYEAGVKYAAAYPGTPSTEILENLLTYKEIISEWASNEKTALEAVVGASIGGARAICAMKHVGLNVAADPLFTFAYMGVNGGAVIVTADEPGMFSSQNEQDNRNYAYAAKVPLFEPADAAECKDMVVRAFDISEQHNTPVLIRVTTRVCHSKSKVTLVERQDAPIRDYERNSARNVCVPAQARVWREGMEDRYLSLKDASENAPENYIEPNNSKIGIIASGVTWHYAHEVFGDTVSYLKLGFTNPMPTDLITKFCESVEQIYILEENDPIIYRTVKGLGFDCKGHGFFPTYGELLPDTIRKTLGIASTVPALVDSSDVINRPPTFCAGCPHRGIFLRLGKRKDIVISGDIGCYSLALSPPYNAMDTSLCMGAAFSLGHGLQKVLQLKGDNRRVVGVMGDSTFFHTGVNSLINTVYNGGRTVNIILDNRITAMTGHQENPGTGFTADGIASPQIDIETLCRAIGVDHISVIDPNDLKACDAALDDALAYDGVSVIITRYPCVLKKFSDADKAEFAGLFQSKSHVDEAICIGCKMCLRSGCPALSFKKEAKKATIDPSQCVGCFVCGQLCPVKAIKKEA